MSSRVAHLSNRQVRRLALASSGLLKPDWIGLPKRAAGRGARARRGAQAIIRRLGYLQLDTISVSGARSHGLVLSSRLAGFEAGFAEELLQPGEPLFEYWGHEASWLPMELYPTFDFRRRDCATHPWWGDVLGEHPEAADELLRRIRDHGPLRSAELESNSPTEDTWTPNETWYPKLGKRIAVAFWSRGDLAIRRRSGFQRVFDLAERCIPEKLRNEPQPLPLAMKTLLLRALAGYGWAQTGSLAATWRLRNRRAEISAALAELEEEGQIVACSATAADGGSHSGWVRPEDVALAQRLDRVRPRADSGVLLSPFDPLIWDRTRTRRIFGFEHIMEIFKPKQQRRYGYYCLPVLAGDRLVARVDLKADRGAGRLELLACHYEDQVAAHRRAPERATERATKRALSRHCETVGLVLGS